MSQVLDESLLVVGAFTVVVFALPFVMAWLERSAKPPPRRSAARREPGERERGR